MIGQQQHIIIKPKQVIYIYDNDNFRTLIISKN